MKFAQLALALLLACSSAFAAATPEWIWHPNNGARPADQEVRYFRKTFTLDGPARRATLAVSADNKFTAYLNGAKIGSGTEWSAFPKFDIKANVKPGENVIAIEAQNDGGSAGLLAEIDVATEEGTRTKVVTDATWQTGTAADAGWQTAAFKPTAAWVAPKSLGKLGVQPWGNLAAAAPGAGKMATPAEALTVHDGFKVELLHSAKAGEGSWVAMTIDPQGRLIMSPQGKEPLLRVTLDAKGQIASMEKIETTVGSAMGLLYAFDSLYVNGQGPQGYHLYRLRDTGNGKFGEPELIRKWKGGPGEHGAHGIVLGPDQKLYIVNGMIHVVDVYPTLVRLAGGSTAKARPLDGLDVWGAIAEGKPSPRTEIVYNVEPLRAAIRQGDWKLVWITPLPQKVELYDLAKDPFEQKNVAAEHPAEVAKLERRVDELAAQAAESLFMKVEAGKMLEGMHGAPVLPED